MPITFPDSDEEDAWDLSDGGEASFSEASFSTLPYVGSSGAVQGVAPLPPSPTRPAEATPTPGARTNEGRGHPSARPANPGAQILFRGSPSLMGRGGGDSQVAWGGSSAAVATEIAPPPEPPLPPLINLVEAGHGARMGAGAEEGAEKEAGETSSSSAPPGATRGAGAAVAGRCAGTGGEAAPSSAATRAGTAGAAGEVEMHHEVMGGDDYALLPGSMSDFEMHKELMGGDEYFILWGPPPPSKPPAAASRAEEPPAAPPQRAGGAPTDRRGYPVVFPARAGKAPATRAAPGAASSAVAIPPAPRAAGAGGKKPLSPSPASPASPAASPVGGAATSPARSPPGVGTSSRSPGSAPPPASSPGRSPGGTPHESYMRRRNSEAVRYEAMLDGEWWDVEVVHPDDYGDSLPAPPPPGPGGAAAPAGGRGYADPDIGGGRTVVGTVPPVPGMIMVQYYADASERWWVKPQSELRPRASRARGRGKQAAGGDDDTDDYVDRMRGVRGGSICMLGAGRCYHRGCNAAGRILARAGASGDAPAPVPSARPASGSGAAAAAGGGAGAARRRSSGGDSTEGSAAAPFSLAGTGLGVLWGEDLLGLDDESGGEPPSPPDFRGAGWRGAAGGEAPGRRGEGAEAGGAGGEGGEGPVEGGEGGEAPAEPPPFPLLDLDDNVLSLVVPHLGGKALASFASTCTRLRDVVLSSPDALWGGVQSTAGRHPSQPVEGSWRRAYLHGVAIDHNWRRRRFQKTEYRHHTDYVYHVSINGDFVLTASADRTAKLSQVDLRSSSVESAAIHAAVADAGLGRDLPRGSLSPLVEYNGHQAHATCAAFLPGGLRVVTASTDDCLMIWDTASGEMLDERRAWSGAKGVVTFCLSPMGDRVVMGTSGTCTLGVKVYDIESGGCTAIVPYFGAEVYQVAAGPGEIYGACGDSQLRCWDPRSGGLIHEATASRRGSARCVAVDGAWVATGGADGTVRVFDNRTWRPLRTLPLHSDVVNCLQLDRGLGWMISGGDDCKLAPVRTNTLDVMSSISTRVGALSIAFDHSRIVAGCEDSVVRMWDFQINEAEYIDEEAMAFVARSMELRLRRGTGAEHGAGPSMASETDYLLGLNGSHADISSGQGISRKW